MTDFRDDPRVAVVRDAPVYSSVPPYDPSEAYPEWPGGPVAPCDNPAYRGVRRLFRLLALDPTHTETETWNPLGALIRPGHAVVLKPNFVSHANLGARSWGLTDTDSLVTHGSMIRAVLDYVGKALNGRGRVLIADCPIQGADWEALLRLVGMPQIEAHFLRGFPGVTLEVRDGRLGRAVMQGERLVERIIDERDRDRYIEVDLGRDSLLLPLMTGRYAFGVAQYSKRRMRRAHTPTSNRYLFQKDIVDADVVINLAKMKTHMKAGVTGALKNLVGINGHKDYLPHFRFGSPKHGGDEYPDGNWLWDLMWLISHAEWELERGPLKRLLASLTRVCAFFLPPLAGLPRHAGAVGGGSWYGNDTLWRTVLDINRAFFYYDSHREAMSDTPRKDRPYLAILDGLVAGQNESPLAPTPNPAGVMMAAFNPLAMDATAATMMGLDVHRLKQIAEGFRMDVMPLAHFPLERVRVVGLEGIGSIADLHEQGASTPCEPSRGFKGHIEHRRKDDDGQEQGRVDTRVEVLFGRV